MECPKCTAQVSMSAAEAAHDSSMIEVLVECDNPDCEWIGYTFVSSSDLCSGESV